MSCLSCIDDYWTRIQNPTCIVLQYQRESDKLWVWLWWVMHSYRSPSVTGHQPKRPTSKDIRVPPCMLQDHWISHCMVGPCCLCLMMDTAKPDYIEAAIYIIADGEQAGRYVATCAKNECGYAGKSHYSFLTEGGPHSSPWKCHCRNAMCYGYSI